MNKKIRLTVALAIALICMAVTFCLTMSFSMERFNATISSVKDKERMYNKLAEIDRSVRANAYYPINDDTLNDMLAYGYMLGISDPYARYYSARTYAERQGLASGRLMGIGVSVVKDASSGYGRILRVYSGSPAAEMGLQSGGFITAIGDTSVRTLADSAAITSALLGEAGTTVTLGYLTPERTEANVEIRRANYTTTTVYPQLLYGACGYIRIDAFSENTGTEFRAAVDSLLQQGAVCLVFDLRDNSGESISAALVAADRCVPAGLVAQSQASDGTTTDLRVSDGQEVTVPMACLVNGSTAGGAELFANALRKMAGAAVVGTATAGRGVLLCEPQSLSDGSALVLTIGVLLDNEGASWNGVGLAPDAEVTLSSDELANYYSLGIEGDPQIMRAVSTVMTQAGQGDRLPVNDPGSVDVDDPDATTAPPAEGDETPDEGEEG